MLRSWLYGPSGIRKIGLFSLVVLILGSGFGCAGGAAGGGRKKYDCNAELAEFRSSEFCEEVAVEQLETRITQFRKKCKSLAKLHQNRKMLTDKLVTSRKCVEEKRERDLRRLACTRNFEEADLNMICVGKECDDYKAYVDGLLADCDDPDLEGVYVAQAEALYSRIEQRKKNAKRIRIFQELSDTCATDLERIPYDSPKRSKNLFESTVKLIRQRGKVKADYKEGSELEVVRAMSLATCEQTLHSLLEIILADYAKKLSMPKFVNNPDRWKGLYKEVKVIRGRLKKLNAETFLPLPLELVNSVLDKFDPNKAPPPE